MLNAVSVSARARICASLFASLFVLIRVANAVPLTLESAATRGQTLMREGRYGEAGEIMRDALKANRDADPDDPRLGLLLNNLGVYYQDLRDWKESRAAFSRALAIFERRRHPSRVTTAANLGALLLECGQSRAAARLWDKTLDREVRALPGDDNRLVRVLVFRANLLATQKHYADAETVAARALAIAERNFGPADVSNVLILNALSLVQWRLQRYDAAAQNIRRALGLLETAYGPTHAMRARLYANLADVCASAGRYDDADLYSRKGLEIAVANFGRDNRITAGMLFERAALLRQANRKDEADAARLEGRNALANAFKSRPATVDVTELAR